MCVNRIPSSELIINGDGSIFHLHLRPHEMADTILLVGDPGRVEMVASYFDRIDYRAANREFVTVTGAYRGMPLTVVSTGIGTDNIDIVVNELDALANIDFATRAIKPLHRALTLLRLGTSGALQADINVGDFVFSDISIGFDGLLNFYARRNEVCLPDYEAAFVEHMQWSPQLATPYFIPASDKLAALFADSVIRGITISAPGFYGPQGRVLRLPLADAQMNERIETFTYHNRRITNFEMESSALAGLSKLLGHEAGTICCIIANRVSKTALPDYQPDVRRMVEMALDKLRSKK
jgi:uridine phosphorylase